MIRAAIVDDEAPARRKVRSLLEQEADVKIAGEAASGPEAVELLRSVHPDLVFLDIQMPGLDGFGVIEAIGVEAMPLVVFVTAYDEHALRAFEVHAFDYLLKPFAPRRFQGVLARARERLSQMNQPAAPSVATRLEELLAEVRPAPRYLKHLLVERSDGREILLLLETVDILRAQRNDVLLLTRDATYRRRATLKELLDRCDPDQFLQINRSEAVRLGAVKETQAWFHGDHRVVMENGAVLSWSRRYRAQARGRF